MFLQFQTYYTGLLKSVRPTCDVFCIIYSHCLTGKIGRFMLKKYHILFVEYMIVKMDILKHLSKELKGAEWNSIGL